MEPPLRDQFLALPSPGMESADAILLPLPFERTTTYGQGTWRAPRAIIQASREIETFDEEALVDFRERPRLYTAPPVESGGDVQVYLETVRRTASSLRGRFVLGLGGEHTVTYGLVRGLTDSLEGLTIVHVDAHADLIDRLEGQAWSHGTVMRRLWEKGCRLVQIGIRSLSREEYNLIQSEDRVTTYFAHQLHERWDEVLAHLAGLKGDIYLTFDVDGLDASIVPSTGTPQPEGLTWRQAMQVVRTVAAGTARRLVGADVVELVPSATPPGCDIVVAKLVMKILAFRFAGLSSGSAPG